MEAAVVASPPVPHAAVAVDLIIFTVADDELQTLLVELRSGPFAGRWAFPGGLVGVADSVDEAAARELASLGGPRGTYLEQLRTFGDPARDPQARVVSTAYLALVPKGEILSASDKYAAVAWWPVRRLPPLAYDHDTMARCALERLRAKLEYTNIVYALLPREFTLGELHHLYERILGRRLDRRNFRKKLLATKLLRPLAKQRRGRHRPAGLYAFTRRSLMSIPIV